MSLYIKTKKIICVITLIIFSLSVYSQRIFHRPWAAKAPVYIGNSIAKSNNAHKNKALYFFPTYANTASIVANNGEKYKLSNINYNIFTNTFDFEISKDSIYVIDNKNINSITINSKVFKNYFDSENNKDIICQTIYENNDFSFLREDKIVSSEVRDALRQGEPKTKLTRIVNYYIKKKKEESLIYKVKLNKKSILALFDDKRDFVMDFIKKNRLSIKKEKDLIRIFQYYNKQKI